MDLSAALSGAVTPGQVAHAIVDRAAGLGTAAAVLWLTTRDGTFELIASMGYADELVERWHRVAPGQDRQLDEAVKTGVVVWNDVASEISSGGAVVPLMLKTAAIGALSLRFAAPPRADEADALFLLALGRQCAQAFEQARLYVRCLPAAGRARRPGYRRRGRARRRGGRRDGPGAPSRAGRGAGGASAGRNAGDLEPGAQDEPRARGDDDCDLRHFRSGHGRDVDLEKFGRFKTMVQDASAEAGGAPSCSR